MKRTKRTAILIMVIIMAVLQLSACGNTAKTPDNNVSNTKKPSNSQSAPTDKPNTINDLDLSQWPSDKLPEGTPEYTGGKVINTGGSDENFIILVEGTNESINTYLEQLEGVGYSIDKPGKTAKKGSVNIELNDRNDGTWQIDVVTFAATDWPDTIPTFILAPEGKTLIGEPYLDDQGSFVNLTLDVGDMSEDEGKAWLDDMAETWTDSSSGSDGSGQRTGTVEHNGKSWQVIAEIYEASDGVFSVQFSWNTEE